MPKHHRKQAAMIAARSAITSMSQVASVTSSVRSFGGRLRSRFELRVILPVWFRAVTLAFVVGLNATGTAQLLTKQLDRSEQVFIRPVLFVGHG
jgi:hypothetical protein